MLTGELSPFVKIKAIQNKPDGQKGHDQRLTTPVFNGFRLKRMPFDMNHYTLFESLSLFLSFVLFFKF